MFGRKMKFAALVLATGMMQFQFGGCGNFFTASARGFNQTFGASLGEALGISLGSISALLDLINQLSGGLIGTAA